jgi:hypothetical protein
MSGDDNTSLTTAKTLWTETILEILYQSLKANKKVVILYLRLGRV